MMILMVLGIWDERIAQVVNRYRRAGFRADARPGAGELPFKVALAGWYWLPLKAVLQCMINFQPFRR